MQGIRNYSLYIMLAVFLVVAIIAGLSQEFARKKVVEKQDDTPMVIKGVENESEETEERQGRAHFEGQIYKGVRIGAVDVSGKTPEEAAAAVDAYISETGSIGITLRAEGIPPMEVTLSAFHPYWENTGVIDELLEVTEGANVIERYTREKDIEIAGMELPLDVSFDKQVVMEYLSSIDTGESGTMINIAESAAMIQNTLFDRVLAGEREFTLPSEQLLIYDTDVGVNETGIEEMGNDGAGVDTNETETDVTEDH